MKLSNILFAICLLAFATQTQAQKPFGTGVKTKKGGAAIDQTDLVWGKGKKTFLLCPTKPLNAKGYGERSLHVFDAKGKKELSKKVALVNESNKPHQIEKLFLYGGKPVCIHSFYDKAEKKYSLYQTYIGDDGDPEGLGKEILGIETKNPEDIAGIELAFSSDSSKTLVCVSVGKIEAKKEKFTLHCVLLNSEDMGLDHDYPFEIELFAKGNVRAKGAVSNQGTVYAVSETFVKDGTQIKQKMTLHFRDNEETIQAKEFPAGEYRYITDWHVKLNHKEMLIIGGYCTDKKNYDVITGQFVNVFDPGTGEFASSTLSDMSDDAKGELVQDQADKKIKDLMKPCMTTMYIDHADNIIFVSHLFEAEGTAKKLNEGKYFRSLVGAPFKNCLVTMFAPDGEAKWQKAMLSKIQYNTYSNGKVFILCGDGKKEFKVCTAEPNVTIKATKASSPTDPENILKSNLFFNGGDNRVFIIGVSSGNFFINYSDLGKSEAKGKVEKEKKKKK